MQTYTLLIFGYARVHMGMYMQIQLCILIGIQIVVSAAPAKFVCVTKQLTDSFR